MTIKKPVKKTTATQSAKPAADGESGAAPAAPSGGAAIADRFKLDSPDPDASKGSSSKGTKVAVIVGVIALIVAGILVYTFYEHWSDIKAFMER